MGSNKKNGEQRQLTRPGAVLHDPDSHSTKLEGLTLCRWNEVDRHIRNLDELWWSFPGRHFGG